MFHEWFVNRRFCIVSTCKINTVLRKNKRSNHFIILPAPSDALKAISRKVGRNKQSVKKKKSSWANSTSKAALLNTVHVSVWICQRNKHTKKKAGRRHPSVFNPRRGCTSFPKTFPTRRINTNALRWLLMAILYSTSSRRSTVRTAMRWRDARSYAPAKSVLGKQCC